MQPARCLVTGATGAIGPHIVQKMHESGFRVRTLSLDQGPPGLMPVGVEECIGEITDAAAVQSAVRDCETVIHLAALLHIENPPQGCSRITGTLTAREPLLS